MTRQLDLSGNQLVIFSIIHASGTKGIRCSTAQFAYLANISQSAVKRALSTLTNKGYIRFEQDEPRRKRVWFSTIHDPAAETRNFRKTVSGRNETPRPEKG